MYYLSYNCGHNLISRFRRIHLKFLWLQPMLPKRSVYIIHDFYDTPFLILYSLMAWISLSRTRGARRRDELVRLTGATYPPPQNALWPVALHRGFVLRPGHRNPWRGEDSPTCIHVSSTPTAGSLFTRAVFKISHARGRGVQEIIIIEWGEDWILIILFFWARFSS